MDTKLRSFVKAIVWRVIGIFVLAVISLMVTHNWKEVTAITIIFHSIRMVLYYWHERAWQHITWGKVKKPNWNKHCKPKCVL